MNSDFADPRRPDFPPEGADVPLRDLLDKLRGKPPAPAAPTDPNPPPAPPPAKPRWKQVLVVGQFALWLALAVYSLTSGRPIP